MFSMSEKIWKIFEPMQCYKPHSACIMEQYHNRRLSDIYVTAVLVTFGPKLDQVTFGPKLDQVTFSLIIFLHKIKQERYNYLDT